MPASPADPKWSVPCRFVLLDAPPDDRPRGGRRLEHAPGRVEFRVDGQDLALKSAPQNRTKMAPSSVPDSIGTTSGLSPPSHRA